MLRKKLLTKLVHAVTPKKRKPRTVYPPMPDDPTELAKAMFEVADRNAFGRPRTPRKTRNVKSSI